MKFLPILGLALAIATPIAAEPVSVRYSWKLKAEYAGFSVAQQQGLFAEQGLEVSLGEGAGAGAALASLIQGQDDVVVMPAVFALSAISKGMPVKIVALYHPAAPLGIVSFPDNPVRTPADLAGKSIATAPGETVTTYLPAVCAANAIDCDQIKLVSVSTDARYSQFMTKRIDMLGVYLNVDAPALDALAGAPLVRMNLADYGLSLPGLSLVTSDEAIAKKPETLRKFVAAVNQGMQSAKDDPVAAAKAMTADWAAPPAIAVLEGQVQATVDAIPEIAGKPLGWIDEAGLQQALDLLKTTESLPEVLPIERYYTNALLP